MRCPPFPNPAAHRPLLACLSSLLMGLAVLMIGALPARAEFSLPPFPYAASALEPAIDAPTMTLHHDRHHATYVANLSLEALQGQISRFPVAVRNNGGGHWNTASSGL